MFIAGHTKLVGQAFDQSFQFDEYENLLLRTHVELELADQRAVSSLFSDEKPVLVNISAGKACDGKRVLIYAIASFVVSRIHEQLKVNAGIQGLPYNAIGVGTGFSYSDSGPTHYSTEDISLMRTVPNMEILSPSDSVMAANLAEQACYSDKPSYLRLERSVLPIISDESDPLEAGFREIKKGRDICIVSTGNMVHEALACSDELESEGTNVRVVDVYRLKPVNMEGLAELMYKYTFAVSLEEHLLNGGLGRIISELISDLDLPLRSRRFVQMISSSTFIRDRIFTGNWPLIEKGLRKQYYPQ